MIARLIILVGPTYSGKSTIAKVLAARGYALISARTILKRAIGDKTVTRGQLVRLGMQLERRTRGKWLADAVERKMRTARLIAVDSARTAAQLSQLEAVGVRARWATHVIYVTARTKERRRRYATALKHRQKQLFKEASNWSYLTGQRLERTTHRLIKRAHTIIDTSDIDLRDTSQLVANTFK